MNDSNEIIQLQKKIEQKRESIRRCQHDFKEAKYNPEKVNKPYFSHYEPCGSDPYPVYIDSWKDKDRWSRECKKCGKIEYTYTQEPIVKGYKPKF